MFGKQKDPSKTEKATPRREQKMRNEGNVPRSQELPRMVSLYGGMALLTAWVGHIQDGVLGMFRRFYGGGWNFEPTIENVRDLAVDLSWHFALMVLPVLLGLWILLVIVQRIQVGKLWTFKVFKFKWQRFNLVKGLQQVLFSPMTIFRALKSFAFAAILAIIPGYIIYTQYLNFLPMYYATPEGVASFMLEMARRILFYTAIPLLAITIFDVWQTRYSYSENMKMTKSEVKDERRQAEGDPVIKGRQRQKMMQVVQQRMMQNVPRADVVVTNPTHLAVALRYNAAEAPAPVVLAKGADHLAERIKEVAREHHVPIRENVTLARALYKSVEIGDMIPEDLYKAVATLLASIWKLKPRTQPNQGGGALTSSCAMRWHDRFTAT